MDRNEIINRVAAVIIAIVLWVYVISVVNPPTTVTVRQVPVTLLNQDYLDDSKLAIAGDGKYTVDVSLSGKRKDLILTSSDLSATADLNGLAPGQNYITVKVTSPSNTTVSEIRTEKIQVYVDELVAYDKPVELEILNVPSGTELSAISIDHEIISVSGARSLVNMVDRILVTVDAANMSVDEPERMQLTVVPIDSEGNPVKAVNVDHSYVNVTSTLYTVKSVPLYTRVVGTPGLGLELVSSNIPSSISIKGTLLNLSKINYVNAEPLDISGITANRELLVTPILPEGVELAADNGSMKAIFTLSEQGSVTVEADSSAILLEGLSENFTASVPEETYTMQVTAKGGIEDLASLTGEEFTYYVDLSGIDEAGEYDVLVQSRTEKEMGLDVSIEPMHLHVTVELIETPETEPQAEDTTEPDAPEEPAEPETPEAPEG